VNTGAITVYQSAHLTGIASQFLTRIALDSFAILTAVQLFNFANFIWWADWIAMAIVARRAWIRLADILLAFWGFDVDAFWSSWFLFAFLAVPGTLARTLDIVVDTGRRSIDVAAFEAFLAVALQMFTGIAFGWIAIGATGFLVESASVPAADHWALRRPLIAVSVQFACMVAFSSLQMRWVSEWKEWTARLSC